jgi:nucleoside-diphosphate-sugar epimerase
MKQMEVNVSQHGEAMTRILVTGAGGFIGHHLVSYLVDKGSWVRGVDIKLPEFEPSMAHEFELLDLRRWANCLQATRGIDEVYNLAANMGGIGFIESNKAVIMHDNVLINIQMLEAARLNEVPRYLYTSSACVYPGYRQDITDVTALKEEDAYPANAGRPVSQHLWPPRDIRRGPGKVTSGDLPQDRNGRRRRRDRSVGRWRTNPVLLLRWRLR